jgi:HD-GYP domain-containing protein (c-di-GMP phosphodiesterase class II)
MAVEYITSRELVNLIYETMRLMNKSAAHHGMRVSYIMGKMMETRGVYEKYEIADFATLGLLHDIGAFKTDDVRKRLTYEAKNPMPHTIYGYLFLRYLSPLEEQAKMVLYHHTDYTTTQELDYKYKYELEILKVAEIADVWMRSFGDKFDYTTISNYAGTKYDQSVCILLEETVKKHDIFTKLGDKSYRAEYDEMMDYVLFSDDEKDKYLKMLMYCSGLKNEQMVSETIATICVSRELGVKLKLSEADKNEVYYAALLHDIGMLAMPDELVMSERELDEAEKNFIKTHVGIMEQTLSGKLSDEIIGISATHHERFDGSGYPRALKGSVMDTKDAILQISEQVVNSMEDKPYRKAHTKDEIIEDLNNGIISGKYEGIVADTFIKYYDEIISKAKEKADRTLLMQQKLSRNYLQVYNNGVSNTVINS